HGSVKSKGRRSTTSTRPSPKPMTLGAGILTTAESRVPDFRSSAGVILSQRTGLMERDSALIITGLITAAIQQKQVLKIIYLPGVRLVEPHAFGWSTDRNLLLRAYQIEGASASGEHEWWKLFRIDRAGSITPSGDNFDGPRPEYKRGDRAMKGGI